MLNKLFKGELVENRIVIWDIEQSKKIFGDGYYGKPLGVPKPKGTDSCQIIVGFSGAP